MENDRGKRSEKSEKKQTSHQRKIGWVSFGAGIVVTLLVLLGAGMFVVYSGGYNVAASEEHRSLVRWALDTNFHRSVENNARGITAPETITSQMVAEGGEHYKKTCAYCHAGPDGERAEWANGMRPLPPALSEAAAEWEINEVFWLAKHGVRLSGMPAFGETHDDQALWNIAAFVKTLPALAPEEYEGIGSTEPLEPSTPFPEASQTP
ncbi:mono/diheme cytochrome c family protein [Devosia subaequoris]|uniref:Mono/diheme cytochrome c family protein n=1 Tax=Devosia subaequoris TaxID=395930 RepID=A0A7W6IQN7_9HYPH|nr:cytochrome c [Devosia subaequoris]MBB4054065.1 mono/diheme cytochrome c family protein [Devosia subaequoris]MCP1211582.1 cytochrome c [Devosia subaequoris]